MHWRCQDYPQMVRRFLRIDGDQGTIQIIDAPVFGEGIDAGGLTYGESLLKALNDGELNEHSAVVTTGKGAETARFGIVNSLFFDRRRNRLRAKQAGRGGTGTVMRRKGLKAVVVQTSQAATRANQPVDVKGVKKAGAQLKKVLSQMDPTQLQLASWGTTVLVEYMNIVSHPPGQELPERPGSGSGKTVRRHISERVFQADSAKAAATAGPENSRRVFQRVQSGLCERG